MLGQATRAFSVTASFALSFFSIGIAQSVAPTVQTTPQTQNPAAKPPAGTAMVLGQVVDTDGRPVGGALVFMGIARVFTNGEGKFVITDLNKGTYSITVTKPGYQPGAFGRLRPGGTAQTLELADGQKNGAVKITLFRHGSISGTIRDDAGDPLVGVPVWSLTRSYAKGRAFWVDGPSATTDDRGMYRLADLAPGDYALCLVNAQSTMPAALVEAYATARLSGTTSQLQRQYSTATIGFSSRTTEAGIRVGDAVLHTVGPYAGGMIPPTPGEDGVIYSFPSTCFPSSTGLKTAEIISLAAGEERLAADIRLTLVPGVTVDGVVTGPDGPLPNVGVRLAPDFATDLSNEVTWEAALTISDALGRFTFLGVPAGNYTLRALKVPAPAVPQPPGSPGVTPVPPGFVAQPPIPQEPTYWANMPIVVRPDGLSNVAVKLETGFRISGRFVFEGSAAKPTPQIQQAMRISFESADGHPIAYPLAARMDPDGSFSTFQIPPGRYVLRMFFTAGPTVWSLKAAMVDGREISAQPFELQGDLTNVLVTMTDSPSEISGVVRDEDGKIDAGTTVVVFPAEREAWMNFGEVSRRFVSSRVSPAGRWRALSLPPGQYAVAAIDEAATVHWRDPRMLDAIMRVADRFTLAAGEKKTLDLQAKVIR